MEFIKRHGFGIGLGALVVACVGVLFFLVIPQFRANGDLESEIANGAAYLTAYQTEKRREELPNEAIIRAHLAYQSWLKETYKKALVLFAARDKGLEITLSNDGKISQLEFSARYAERMRALKSRMKRYEVDRLFPVERWEGSVEELPDPAEYEWVTKRMWILEDICSVASLVRVNAVESFAVGDPKQVPTAPRIGKTALYRLVPVSLKVQLPFFKASNLLHRFLFPGRKGRRLCTRIKSIHIEKVSLDPAANSRSLRQPLVRVSLELEYLDFQIPDSS